MVEYLGWVVICLLFADIITGVAHWAEDTYCLDGYPVIGKLICEPNIDHHINPSLITKSGTFFSRNLIQWFLSSLTYFVLYMIGFGYWQCGLCLFLASFGNEVHMWNHTTKLGPVPTFFKNSGLVQAQKQHSLHHKPPYLQYYCTLTSFTNEVFELTNFWRGLEYLISLFGIHPKRNLRRDYN